MSGWAGCVPGTQRGCSGTAVALGCVLCECVFAVLPCLRRRRSSSGAGGGSVRGCVLAECLP